LNEEDYDEESFGGEDYPTLALLDLLEANKPEWRRAVIKSLLIDRLWKTEIENKLKRLTKENAAIIALLSTLIVIVMKIAFFGA